MRRVAVLLPMAIVIVSVVNLSALLRVRGQFSQWGVQP
jgi:hypothetical protein